MEELIQWLVILFFIISFLNSILKPKKKTEQNIPSQSGESVLTSGPTVDIPDLREDFEEIIRQKKQEAERKKQELNKELQKRYSEKKTFESVQPELSLPMQRKKQEKVKEILPIEHIIEKHTHVKEQPEFIRALLNPDSARKAILLAEILGKPKALKRKW